MISQVALLCLISVVAARPPYAVPEYPSTNYGSEVHDEQPQPYSFGFNTQDEHGATINQHESGDEHGNKKGSYGYTDGYGVYRQVDYVADEHGFRATVKTNEPGTDNQNPADADILSEAAPASYGKSLAVAAVDPVYSKPAAVAAPTYIHQQPAPAYVESVAAVHGQQVPVSHAPTQHYDAVHVPAYNSREVYDAVHAPGPVNHAPTPVYDAVHAPVYSPAQVYDTAPYSPVYNSAPAPDAHGSVDAHRSASVYDSVRPPVYNGPTYDQLLDKANQVNGRTSEYEPEAIESYNSY